MIESNTFIWNELLTDDEAGASRFYSTLFGWEPNEVDAGSLGTYTLFRRNGRDVAGMMKPLAPDYGGAPPPKWIAYIAVDDCDAIAQRAVELGGGLIEPPQTVPGVGRICLFRDVVGAQVYVMQPAQPPA